MISPSALFVYFFLKKSIQPIEADKRLRINKQNIQVLNNN